MRATKTKAGRPLELGQEARERGRELAGSARERSTALGRSARDSVAKLDVKWAHGPLGDALREALGRLLLVPLMTLYTRRRVYGRENLDGLEEPIVIVANHGSHMDTPAILRALPRRWRRRTVVAAAADYFYRNRLVATVVSVLFNTVPIERRRGTPSTAHIDRLLDRGNNLLLYPEGTRNRKGGVGRLRHGAAAIAAKHGATIVPILVVGTREVMPPGRIWPKRRGRTPLSRRHPVVITIGKPIAAVTEDRGAVTDRIARFLEQGQDAVVHAARRAPWRRRRRKRRFAWLPWR